MMDPVAAGFPCVYKISNLVNGKLYVGSAVHGSKRWYQHRHALRRGTHCNCKLQAAWSKYGEDSFRFSVIERVDDRSLLIQREQFYLNSLQPSYNLLATAGSCLGHKHSAAAKANMSAGQKGKVVTAETRAKLAAVHTGRPRPPHIQAMLRTARLGTKHSPETIRLIIAQGTGKKHSAEWRRNISLGLSGNKNFLGRKHSEEAREKCRQAALAWWSRKRLEMSDHR